MNLDDQFEQATQKALQLPSQSNENLLKLYALYKQSIEGDVTGSRPGLLQVKARAKFDAWSGLKKISKENAKKQYIELVHSLLEDTQP